MRLLLVLALAGCQLPEFVPDDTVQDDDTEIDLGTAPDTDSDTDGDTDTDWDSDTNPIVDEDSDGSPEGEDCDDNDPTRFPENTEDCDDDTDQDCSGSDCKIAVVTDISEAHGFPNRSPVSSLGIVNAETLTPVVGFGNSEVAVEWGIYDSVASVVVGSTSIGGTTLHVVGGVSVAGDGADDWVVYRPQASFLDLNSADNTETAWLERISTTRLNFRDPNQVLQNVVPLPSRSAFALLVHTIDGGGLVSFINSTNTNETTYLPDERVTYTLPADGYGPPTDIVTLRLPIGQPTAAIAHAGDSTVDNAQVLIVSGDQAFTADPLSARIVGRIDLGQGLQATSAEPGPVLFAAQLDGLGTDDLVVGLPSTNCVYIFRDRDLQADLLLTAAWHTYCGGESSRLGWAFADIADRDNDGLRELVITAPGSPTAREGSVQVLYTGRLDTPVSANHPVDILIASTGATDPGLGTSIITVPEDAPLNGDILVTTDYGIDNTVTTYLLNLDLDL